MVCHSQLFSPHPKETVGNLRGNRGGNMVNVHIDDALRTLHQVYVLGGDFYRDLQELVPGCNFVSATWWRFSASTLQH